MAVDVPTFRARFPEFAGIGDATIQVYLDDTVADLDQGIWGEEAVADRATSFLAAHRLATSLDADGSAISGQGGALSAASADGVSSTYAMPEKLSAEALDLWSTVYGQRFLDLRRRYVIGVLGVG